MSTIGSSWVSSRMSSARSASASRSGARAWAAGGVTPGRVPTRPPSRSREARHLLTAGMTPVGEVLDLQRQALGRELEVRERVVEVVAVAVGPGRREALVGRLLDRGAAVGTVGAAEEGGVEPATRRELLGEVREAQHH